MLTEECNLHTIVRCRMEYLTHTQASKLTFCSSPKASQPKTSGSTSTHTQKVWRTTAKPNQWSLKSSNKSKSGGAAKEDGFCFSCWEQARMESLDWRDHRAQINLDIKNPYQEEVVSHDLQELLASYQQQQQEIKGSRNKLKAYSWWCTEIICGEGEWWA